MAANEVDKITEL